jgi:hypothetical protein
MLDDMNDEFWLPGYLKIDNYGASIKKWKRDLSERVQAKRPPRLPSQFDINDESSLVKGNLDLEYVGDMLSEPGSIRTDYAIPNSCQIYYFEVKVLCKGYDWY